MRLPFAVMVAAGVAVAPVVAMAHGGKTHAQKPPHISAPKVHVASIPKPHVPSSLPAHHESHSSGTHSNQTSVPMVPSLGTTGAYSHTGSYQHRSSSGSYHHYSSMPYRNNYRRTNTTASAQSRHLRAIVNDLDSLASNSAAASTLASGGAHTRHVMLHRDLMASVYHTIKPDSNEVEQLTRSVARAMMARPQHGPINTASLARDLMETMNARQLSLNEVRMRTHSAHTILVQGGVPHAEAANVLSHLHNIGLGSHGAMAPGRVF